MYCLRYAVETGIRVDTADYVDIENCIVFDNTGYGILVNNNAEPTDVRKCTVYNSGKSGIRCSTSDTTIIDTISTSNSEWGVEHIRNRGCQY